MKNNLKKVLTCCKCQAILTEEQIKKFFNRGKTMRIHNYTPHDITIINGSLKVVLKSEGVIRAKSVQTQVGTVYHEEHITDDAGHESIDEFPVPEYKMTFGEPEGMPEDIDPDGVYVVSAIAAQALKQFGWAGTYMVTCGAIRDEQGRIIGCQGLARI